MKGGREGGWKSWRSRKRGRIPEQGAGVRWVDPFGHEERIGRGCNLSEDSMQVSFFSRGRDYLKYCLSGGVFLGYCVNS